MIQRRIIERKYRRKKFRENDMCVYHSKRSSLFIDTKGNSGVIKDKYK